MPAVAIRRGRWPSVTGGKTVLKPDVDTFEGFADMSTSVGATGAARDAAKGVVFPISGGEIDEGPKGTIRHRGGLVFAQNIAGGEILKFSKLPDQDQRLGQGEAVREVRADPRSASSTSTSTRSIPNGAGTRVDDQETPRRRSPSRPPS